MFGTSLAVDDVEASLRGTAEEVKVRRKGWEDDAIGLRAPWRINLETEMRDNRRGVAIITYI